MAPKSIGAKIELKGESSFNKAVTDCTRSIKEMQSALKLTKAQTDGSANSLSSLEKRHAALKNVLEAQNNKVKTLNQALENAKSKYAMAGDAVDKLSKEHEEAAKELEEMKKAGLEATEGFAEQQEKVDRLSRELNTANNAYEKTGRAVTDWQIKLNNAETEVEKTNRELEDNSRYMKEAENSTDQLATSVDKYGKAIRTAGDDTKAAQLQMQKALVFNVVQQNIEKLSSAISKLGKEALSVTNDLESGVAKVNTIADTSVISAEELQGAMMQLSIESGRGISEITDATYQAISASVDTANAVSFVGNATNLAKAGFLETADAVDVLTTIINAYKLNADDASIISDKLVQTQNKGKTTVNELSQSMGQVIPLAAAYNVNLDNLSTAYVELTKNGIGTAEAGTMLKGMFSELAKDGSTVSDILKEETGKSFGELMSAGASLGDVLEILYGTVEGNSEAFANLWSNVRAKTGALSLAQTGAAEFNAELSEMTNSAGNVANALEKLDTPAVKASKTMNALKNAGAAIGDSFLSALAPAMETVSKAAQEIAKRINNLSPRVKSVVGILGGLVAVSATLAPKILAVVNTIKGIKAASEAAGAIKALKAAMVAETAAAEGATAAQEGLNAAQAANPIGIVVLAVAGLATALWGLDKAYKAAQAAANPYHEDLVNLQERHKELQQEIENTRSTFDEQMNASAVDATLATNLKQELDELMAVEDKDVSTKEKIKAIVNELNNTVLGLALAYNSESDSLNKTNSEIEKSIELMEQQLKLEAYREGWLDTLQQQAQAEKDLAEAKELVMKMTEGASDATRQALETSVKQGNNLYYSAGLWARLNEEIGEGKWQADELTEAVRLLNSAQDDYNDITEQSQWYSDQYSSSIENMGDAAEGVTADVDDAADSMDGMSAAAYEAALELEGDGEIILETYENLKIKALESINSQISLFQDMSEQADITAEDISNAFGEMNTAFETQQQALTQYADNIDEAMAYVAKSGDSNAAEFVSSIAEMGNDGAVYMAAFVDAIRKEDGSAEQILQNFGKTEEAKEHLAESMAAMSLVTKEEAGKMTESLQNEKDAMTSAAGENAQAAVNKTLEFKEQFLDSGQQSGQEYAGGIGSEKAAVTSAVADLKTTASLLQYSDAYTWGQHLGQEFANGISSKTPDVSNAAEGLANAAAEYLKHSTPKKGALHGDDKWGEEMAQNFAKGMNAKTGEVTSAAKNLASAIQKVLKGSSSLTAARYTKTAQDRVNQVWEVTKLSLAQEEKFWESVIKKTKKGTKEYKTAQKALKSVKKDITNETKSLSKTLVKDIRSATKDMNFQIREIRKTLKEDRRAIQDELEQNIDDLKAAYRENVNARKESITGALSLFDKSSIQQQAAYQKSSYTKILERQVDQLEVWDSTLSSLSSKIKNQGLLAELESLGTDQIAALQAIDSMSAKELAEYENLYKKRDEIANKRAKSENETQHEEMLKQIEELREAAREQKAVLTSEAEEQIKILKNKTDKQIKQLKKTYIKNMRQLGADGAKQSKTVGEMISKGIGTGFKAGMKGVNADLKKQLQTMMKNIKNQLKIKSPSKVMEDEVGENMAKGIEVGFVDQMRAVEQEMQAAIPTNFDTAAAAGTQASAGGMENRVIVENRFYLGEKDVTDMLTKKIVKKITTDTQNYRVSKGALAYV